MIKQILMTGFVVLAIITLLAYLFQRHLIYIPSKEIPTLAAYQAQDMQQVLLQTQDGLVLTSWYKSAAANQPTILFFHGNAGHLGMRMPLIRQFLNEGFGVLLLEYRGYGGNKGTPTESGFYEDGHAALRFLQQKGIKPSQIILYGESLGSGVAIELGTHYPVCALILQSPYTSMVDLARFHYPWLFIKPTDRFDSFNKIKAVNASILIIHGKRDTVVPYKQGLALFNQAHEPKQMLHFEQKDHNDLWNQNFYSQVNLFIKTQCS